MMTFKPFLAALLALTVAPMLLADEQEDRTRKVKVALALSATSPVVAKTIKPECGTCRIDLPAVREECRKTGTPFLIFVGGCYGRSKDFIATGAMMVRVDDYAADERGREKRIVVVGRKGAGPDLVLHETLPADSPPATVLKALKEAKDAGNPKTEDKAPVAPSPAPVNWYAASGGRVYLSGCATGNCPNR